MKNLYVFNVNTRGAMYGIGTYIEQLAKCSIKKDMNVSIVEINASCEEFKVETKNGIRYIYIPWPSVYPSGLGFARLLTIIQNYIPFFLKEEMIVLINQWLVCLYYLYHLFQIFQFL